MNLILIALTFISSVTFAAVETKQIIYKQGDTELEGFIASPKGKGRHPAVVVIHDWYGLSDNTKMRAKMLAELGYVAFAADIYGKGIRPKNNDEASSTAKKFYADHALLRARAQAAFDEVAKQKNVDSKKIAVMGYCFGGKTSLELARSGAPITGAISFHGGLSTTNPADAKNIKGKVLVLHGADDPFVSEAEVAGFQKEMREAKVDWQFVAYGNAVHSFTIKSAGNDNSKGAAYNESADRRSWEEAKRFFKEIF